MRKPIKIQQRMADVPFWQLVQYLRLDRYFTFHEVEDYDFLIYGGNEPLPVYDPRNAIKILFCTEPRNLLAFQYDYAFNFCYRDCRSYLRFPLYCFAAPAHRLIKKPEFAPPRSRFCNFVYSNHNATFRQDFFHLLSTYKRVDAPGVVCNNMPRLVPHQTHLWQNSAAAKVRFQSLYKFSIAFENTEKPGYTTEKLVHPMLGLSIPIYWGNPYIHRDFNTNSFFELL